MATLSDVTKQLVENNNEEAKRDSSLNKNIAYSREVTASKFDTLQGQIVVQTEAVESSEPPPPEDPPPDPSEGDITVSKKIEEARAAQAAMKKSLEEQGKIATDNKKYNKLAYNTTKEELKQRYKDATSPSAKKEIRAEQKALANKQEGLLNKISQGIGGIAKGMKNMATKSIKGAGSLLKKSLFAGMYLALLAFVNSKYWDKFIDIIAKAATFMTEKIIPIVTFLWEKVLKPLGDALKDGFLRAWEDIKGLFDDLGEAMDLFKEGKILEGIYATIKGLTTFIGRTIDNAITTIYNVFAKWFGWTETDSVGRQAIDFFRSLWQKVTDFFTVTIPEVISNALGWLSGIGARIGSFFKDIWSGVTNFFTVTIPETITAAKNELIKIKDSIMGIFTDLWDGVTLLFGEWNVFQFIDQTLGELFSSLKAIFGGDFSVKTLLKGALALFDLATAGINLAINAVMDIFKWGDPNKPFRLSEFILGVFEDVTKWITKLFDIDFESVIKSIMPGGKVGRWLTRKLFGDGKDIVDGENVDGPVVSDKAMKKANKEAKIAQKSAEKEVDLYTVDFAKIDKKRNEDTRKRIEKLESDLSAKKIYGKYGSTEAREADETRLSIEQTGVAKRQGLTFSGGGEYGNFPDIKPVTNTNVDTMRKAKQAENAERSAGAGTTVTSVNPTSISADKTTNHYSFDNKRFNPDSVPTMLTNAL